MCHIKKNMMGKLLAEGKPGTAAPRRCTACALRIFR
jgi:hypothetical protein